MQKCLGEEANQNKNSYFFLVSITNKKTKMVVFDTVGLLVNHTFLADEDTLDALNI